MPAIKYSIDPTHSSAHFSVRHLMVSNVRGEFTKLSGTITFDPQNVASSSVEATIEIDSINTREPQRDAHLKSPDFFDIEKFPTMTFTSTLIEPTADGGKLTGNLTIHGVTKSVTLDVEGPAAEIKDPWGLQRIGVSATTKISRKDFGLVYNSALETGGVVIGDEIKIEIELEAVRS